MDAAGNDGGAGKLRICLKIGDIRFGGKTECGGFS